jgi:hypothetical protein
VRVYLDENLSPAIAEVLREARVDAVAAHEAGNIQRGDRAQLAHATQDRRAIVTANIRDFVELAREAVAMNAGHGGIILVPPSFRGDEFQAIADAILRVFEQYPSGLADLIVYIRRQ